MVDPMVFGRPVAPGDMDPIPTRRPDRRVARFAITEPAAQTPCSPPPDYPWLAVTQGRPHQVAASAWRRGYGDGNEHPNAGLEMGLGTGKTLIVVEEALKLKKALGGRVKVLVLAPNSVLRTVWDVQVPQHGGGQLRHVVMDMSTAKRRAILKNRMDDFDVFVHATESYPMMALDLNTIPWDLVAIDEHQDFRNYLSERAKALLGRGRYRGVGPLNARTKLMGSGTPAIKKATDVYAPYKWLANAWGTVAQFRTAFGVVMGGFGGHEEVGVTPEGAGLLRSVLDRHRYVVPASVLGFPEPVFHYRRVDLPDWQRTIYKRVQDDLKTIVDGEEALIVNKLTEMLRLAQVTSGLEAIDADRYEWHDNSAKATYLFDQLLPEVFSQEDRAVIWCWFRPTIRELARMATERGYRPTIFWGGDNEQKAAAQAAFNSGQADLFIGQMRAGGRGLNLSDSRTMIFFDLTFDTEAWIQALGRDQRADSKDRLVRNRIILQGADTIDPHMTEVLRGDVTLASLLSSVRLREILG